MESNLNMESNTKSENNQNISNVSDIQQKQHDAIAKLIQGCILAQKRGVYTFEEASEIHNAIKLLVE